MTFNFRTSASYDAILFACAACFACGSDEVASDPPSGPTRTGAVDIGAVSGGGVLGTGVEAGAGAEGANSLGVLATGGALGSGATPAGGGVLMGGGVPASGGEVGSGSGGVTAGSAITGGTMGGGSGGDASPDSAALLVPAEGALLGMFYGADSLAVTATKVGLTPRVHLTYYAWEDDWTGRGTQADLDAGRIPIVNWEPFSPAIADIAAGNYDSMLRTRAASAKALGKPFFLDFGAEMNGDWSPWGGADNGMGPDLYIAAYRHVHDVFIAAGATNVVWLWCPNVTDEPRASWNAALGYYPGADYVDWACVDGYNWGATQGGWQTFAEVFEDIYARLATLNKPIMIGEMASAEVGGDKAAWIDGIIPTLKRDFPLIKGLVWFDIDKETDWRISSSPGAEAAFARLANDPYFNP